MGKNDKTLEIMWEGQAFSSVFKQYFKPTKYNSDRQIRRYATQKTHTHDSPIQKVHRSLCQNLPEQKKKKPPTTRPPFQKKIHSDPISKVSSSHRSSQSQKPTFSYPYSFHHFQNPPPPSFFVLLQLDSILLEMYTRAFHALAFFPLLTISLSWGREWYVVIDDV